MVRNFRHRQKLQRQRLRRLQYKVGTIPHEIGHTLLLKDDYGGGGLMGSPPNYVSPSEVSEIVKNSYEK